MTFLTVLLILGLALFTWALLDAASDRDTARAYAGRVCGELGVQLLDQTVALTRTRLVRNRGGSIWLERQFRFEFSESGNDRYPGHMHIRGGVPAGLVLDGERIGHVVMGAANGDGRGGEESANERK